MSCELSRNVIWRNSLGYFRPERYVLLVRFHRRGTATFGNGERQFRDGRSARTNVSADCNVRDDMLRQETQPANEQHGCRHAVPPGVSSRMPGQTHGNVPPPGGNWPSGGRLSSPPLVRARDVEVPCDR